MRRPEAISVLKELVTARLIQPSMVSIEHNRQDSYSLVMKDGYDPISLGVFLVGRGLVCSEDKEKGTCTIYKP